MADDITFYALSPVDKLVDGAFQSDAVGQPDATFIYSVVPGDTELVVNWPISTGATGYELRVDGGSAIDVGNVIQYVVGSLTNSVEYDIEVRAYNANGYSAWSDIVSGTPVSLGVDWYVATDGNDTTGDGSLSTPYATVQKAVDVMSGGDIICLRGGTYAGYTTLTTGENGTSEDWSTFKSYPGEWAVLDGENALPNSHPNRCVIGNSNDQALAYFKFERLEIKNGRTLDGTVCAGFWGDYGPYHFKHCYIHDNYATVNPGSDGTNGGVRGKKWQNCIVEYSHFANNGALTGAAGHNYGDINITSDYVENPASVVIGSALQKNIYRYNIFESVIGIKYKNSQWLSLDHTSTHTTYDDYGDDIHHNIFLGNEIYAVDGRQDFIQIHNNLFINSGPVSVGESGSDDREPFYACVYNNHFVGTRFSFVHSGGAGGDSSSYDPPIIGNFYGYNNIVDDVGTPSDNNRDINFHFTYSSWDLDNGDITMSAIVWENNLLMGRQTTDQYIVVGDNDDRFSVNEYVTAGYSTVFYQDTGTLFTDIGSYAINGAYSLGGADTIANGGIGGNHPYLAGVTIPGYVGAANPSDQDWVAGVYGLTTSQNIIDATSADPSWVEGA